MADKKSIGRQLAEAHAAGAARSAEANPSNKMMRRIAAEAAEQARNTK